MIGRADIEGSKSNVAMNALLQQDRHPSCNLSDTSIITFIRPKGSIGHYPQFVIASKIRMKKAFPLLVHIRFLFH